MSEKTKNIFTIAGLLIIFAGIMWFTLDLSKKYEKQHKEQQEFYNALIGDLNHQLLQAKQKNDSSQERHSEKIKTIEVIKHKQIIKYENIKAGTDTLSFDSAGRLYKELLRYYKDKKIY